MRKYQTRAKFIFIYNQNTSSIETSVNVNNPSSVLKPQTVQDWQLTKVQTSVTLTQDLAFYTLLIKIF